MIKLRRKKSSFITVNKFNIPSIEYSLKTDLNTFSNALKLQLAKYLLQNNDNVYVNTRDKTYNIVATNKGKSNTLSVLYCGQKLKLRVWKDIQLPENCKVVRRYKK